MVSLNQPLFTTTLFSISEEAFSKSVPETQLRSFLRLFSKIRTFSGDTIAGCGLFSIVLSSLRRGTTSDIGIFLLDSGQSTTKEASDLLQMTSSTMSLTSGLLTSILVMNS